jgi:hypothetical protein
MSVTIFWQVAPPVLKVSWDSNNLRVWEVTARRPIRWHWVFWSGTFELVENSVDELRGHVQDAVKNIEDVRIDGIPHPSLLVLYRHEGARLFYVIAAAPSSEMLGFSTDAPEWWHPGTSSKFVRRLYDVDAKVKALSRDSRYGKALREAPVAFHCNRCGLPDAKHVPHEPQGVAKPVEGSPPQDWAPWMRAARDLYGTALRTLTDEELLRMPLGVNRLWLRLIGEELRRRDGGLPYEAPVAPPSALDMLLLDDED